MAAMASTPSIAFLEELARRGFDDLIVRFPQLSFDFFRRVATGAYRPCHWCVRCEEGPCADDDQCHQCRIWIRESIKLFPDDRVPVTLRDFLNWQNRGPPTEAEDVQEPEDVPPPPPNPRYRPEDFEDLEYGTDVDSGVSDVESDQETDFWWPQVPAGREPEDDWDADF